MMKLNLKRTLNLRSLAFAGILAFGVVAVSCNKEDDVLYPETMVENAEFKSGKASLSSAY